ncbi:MAG: hypothetical protein WAS05_09180 [Candidatus Nanopelagicales bacterium]
MAGDGANEPFWSDTHQRWMFEGQRGYLVWENEEWLPSNLTSSWRDLGFDIDEPEPEPTPTPAVTSDRTPKTVDGELYELWWAKGMRYMQLENQDRAGSIRLMREHGTNRARTEIEVLLVATDGRVACAVDGKELGDFPTEFLNEYLQPIANLNARGYIPSVRGWFWCWEGMEHASDPAQVTIQIATPTAMFPINEPPNESHAVLPPDQIAKLTKVDLEAANQIIGDLRHVSAYGVLRVQDNGKRKPTVNLEVDGILIGSMSPVMSAHFVPTIAALESSGRLTAVRCELEGNRLSADAGIRAVRAKDLTSDQVDLLTS